MKHFLLKTLLVVTPLFILCITYEIMLRQLDNDYKYKNNYMEEHADSIQILSLGSSHGHYGIDPEHFDLRGFNCGHPSQDLEFDFLIFTKFITKMSSLEYLIIPISVFTPFSDLAQREPGQIKCYVIYYHISPKDSHLFQNSEILSNGILKGNIKNIIKQNSLKDCSRLGHGTNFNLSDRNQNWDNGINRAKHHTRYGIDMKRYCINHDLLDEIIQRCVERKVKVILLTTPTYHTYSENLPKDMLCVKDSFCNYFKEKYDNVSYLNLMFDERFDEHDYYDADHLNEYGAAKLTKILNGFIMDGRNKTSCPR